MESVVCSAREVEARAGWRISRKILESGVAAAIYSRWPLVCGIGIGIGIS